MTTPIPDEVLRVISEDGVEWRLAGPALDTLGRQIVGSDRWAPHDLARELLQAREALRKMRDAFPGCDHWGTPPDCESCAAKSEAEGMADACLPESQG